MKNFIGIDLGTTNSSISSFDGDKVKMYNVLHGHDYALTFHLHLHNLTYEDNDNLKVEMKLPPPFS